MTREGDDLRSVQMLHPMTLLQRFLVSLPAFVLLLWPLLRSGGGASDVIPVVMVVLYGVLALPLIFLRYFRFRYQVTEREILIHSGVLNRKHRSIPLERIQNIEIEQSLLPRLFGTAKVKVETAGSAQTEGVLEYVSLDRARAIREIVRRYQQQSREEVLPPAPDQPTPPPVPAPDREVLLHMPVRRVLLVGMLRFSLLYIALAFSALQQLNPDPDEIELWLTRGWLEPIAAFAMASPWVLTAIVVVLAVLLSWIAGILVSLNKHFRFTLWLEGGKLHKRSGLLTLSEGTIPLKRVQALIFRANALMRHFGWYALQLQTMGLESSQQGHQLAAPLARLDEAKAIGQRIQPFALPETFLPVSRLTIRRAFVRYLAAILLTTGVAGYWMGPSALGFLMFVPFAAGYAVLRYRKLGYALDEERLYVRKGVLIHSIWVLPASKFQVLYTTSSFFQRRLGLRTVYVDTAGAGGITSADIVDLPAEEADGLIQLLYARFSCRFPPHDGPPADTEASARS
jgi:putative membrane protein